MMDFVLIFVQRAQYLLERFAEYIVVAIYRVGYYYKIRGKYDCKFEQYIFKKSWLDKDRKDGISGFYRVKNEEEILSASLDSHIPFLDEIIIVYNGSTDNTPQIINEYVKKFPQIVKAYHYKPNVHPPFSKLHVGTPSSSPHSLVNYYNYALSKTTKKIVVKIDADHIAIPEKFKQVTDSIRETILPGLVCFSGVNLSVENGQYCVHNRVPFTSGRDQWFFPVSINTYFVHRKNWEFLHVPLGMWLGKKWAGVLFYHLRGIKSDRGIKNYGTDTKISTQHRREVENKVCIDWEDSVNQFEQLRKISNPNNYSVGLQCLIKK